MICNVCGSEMIKCSDPIEEDFRGEELTISGIEHYKCSSCDEIVFDAVEGKKFDKALREQYAKNADLLSPGEIKAVRKKLGLNQQEFQRMLGVSSPSVSRWENGKVPQSKPVDLLIRAYDDSPRLAEERMRQLGLSRPSNVILVNFKAEKTDSQYSFPQDWEAKEE